MNVPPQIQKLITDAPDEYLLGLVDICGTELDKRGWDVMVVVKRKSEDV